jgi:uncharacterized paraquat-inducible protein A
VATYHGITGASCPECDYSTADEYTPEIMNDVTGCCPRCGGAAIDWHLIDDDDLA